MTVKIIYFLPGVCLQDPPGPMNQRRSLEACCPHRSPRPSQRHLLGSRGPATPEKQFAAFLTLCDEDLLSLLVESLDPLWSFDAELGLELTSRFFFFRLERFTWLNSDFSLSKLLLLFEWFRLLGWGSGTRPPPVLLLHFLSQPFEDDAFASPELGSVATATSLPADFRPVSALTRGDSNLRLSAASCCCFLLSAAWSLRLRESEFRLLTGGLAEPLLVLAGGELSMESWLPLANLDSSFFCGISSTLPKISIFSSYRCYYLF